MITQPRNTKIILFSGILLCPGCGPTGWKNPAPPTSILNTVVTKSLPPPISIKIIDPQTPPRNVMRVKPGQKIPIRVLLEIPPEGSVPFSCWIKARIKDLDFASYPLFPENRTKEEITLKGILRAPIKLGSYQVVAEAKFQWLDVSKSASGVEKIQTQTQSSFLLEVSNQ